MFIFAPCFASSLKTAHDEFPMQPSFPDGILPLLQKNCQKSASISPQFHEHPSSSSSEIRKIGMPTECGAHRERRTLVKDIHAITKNQPPSGTMSQIVPLKENFKTVESSNNIWYRGSTPHEPCRDIAKVTQGI
jgi:hypothetical protein